MRHGSPHHQPLVHFSVLFQPTRSSPAGVNSAIAPSASPPISNVTFATSTIRRNPSSATCATAVSVSRPIWTATLRSTKTAVCQVGRPVLLFTATVLLWHVIIYIWYLRSTPGIKWLKYTLGKRQNGRICVLLAGTAMSSPQSEVDNCGAILDDKEDSYFNEIKNFISNTGQNQMSPGSSEEG